ncbi:MAG: hypothetical protein V3W31_09820 [Thermodesulfobacteriota bacterium]
MERGDAFYAKRGEGHTGDWASTEPIERALSAYLKAYELGDSSAELSVKILQSTYFYATYAEKDKKAQKAALQKAREVGEAAAAKHPGDGPLNYQMGGIWGRWGEVNGIIASARKGVADKVRVYAEKAVSLDPGYASGGGYRTLGRLNFKAPYIPLILSWPSKKEALKYLKKAVEVGPENLTNHLFYAENLYHAKSYDEALTHVGHVLDAEIDSSKVVEDLRDKEDAQKLKEKIEARQ